MSPVLRYNGENVSIFFRCPRKCRAISYVGIENCVASHVLVIASCLNFSNVKRILSAFIRDWNIDLNYIMSVAKLVSFLRIRNFKFFNKLYCDLLNVDDEFIFDVFAKCFLLTSSVGLIFYNLNRIFNDLHILINSKAFKHHKLLKSLFRKLKSELKRGPSIEDEFLGSGSDQVFPRNSNCSERIFVNEVVDLDNCYEPVYLVKHNFTGFSCIPPIWAVSTILRFKRGGRHPRIGHGYFSSLFDFRFSLAKKIVRRVFPEFPYNLADQVALSATFDSIGFYKLHFFFLDDDVEELFIDAPNTFLYLDHSSFGRCRTNIMLSRLDIERVITQLKAESGLNLDITSPSLKTDLITKLFHLRVSVDVPPLTVDGPSLIFRRFKRKPLTIIDLVKNETITSEAAAYLIFCLFNRRNILVIGEPASGKTTLVNALDMITPPHWRKISIESVVESVRQISMNKHQVRFRVDPIERHSYRRRKIYEVEKLLHRSPGYLFLGEILTSEHTKALFNALASGLRGFQTCHANSPEGLLVRWVIHHNIPIPCLADLDLIVLMKHVLEYRFNRRYVCRVSELLVDKSAINLSDIKIVDVFRRNFFYDYLKPVIDLYESPVIFKIRGERRLSRDEFYNELSFYRKIIDLLCDLKVFSPKKVSNVFARAYVFARSGCFDIRRFIVEASVTSV